MRFVITSGHPNLHGTIGCYDRYDSIGVVLIFKDSNGFTTSCSFPLDTVRELDDSPIAAGDEVVCVDASDIDGVEAGKSYRVTTVKGDLIAFSGNYRAMNKDRFVKVKPLPQSEVKQEAVEPEPNFDYQSAPPTKREPANCLTRVGREFWMVKGFGPTQCEHDSLDSAMIEAERLARAHPGVPFTVLGPVSIFFNGMARIDRNFDDGMPF